MLNAVELIVLGSGEIRPFLSDKTFQTNLNETMFYKGKKKPIYNLVYNIKDLMNN